MKLIINAFEFAKNKHAGQKRKGSGEDYFTHPVAVSYIVARYKVSRHLEELIAAAYLHDCLEDTSATFAEIADNFGPLVASIVFGLTNDDAAIAEMGKAEYLKQKLCGVSNYVLILKLADRIHNISDNPSCQMIRDTVDLVDCLEYNRKLTKTQQKMCEDLRDMCDAIGRGVED